MHWEKNPKFHRDTVPSKFADKQGKLLSSHLCEVESKILLQYIYSKVGK